jgi:ferredoxin
MAQYLRLPRGETLDKVPYVYMLDSEDRVHRLVVRRALVAFARKCLVAWRGLQELSAVSDSHALRLRERELAQSGAEQEPASPAPDESSAAGSAPADAAPPQQAKAEPSEQAAEPPDSGQAFVDTDLCTTCDDCTDRNPAMFAYDDAKQAYIKDITAGSYRELVEAAENCPVCIIHPGKPHDPDEPGLEELQKRAAAFS